MPKQILLFVLLSLSSTLAAQNRIYVHTTATGTDTGTSWSDAYTDLQCALQTATTGDSIWVSADTYYPTSDTSRNISFEVPSGVSLFGGFMGTESELTQRPMDTKTTLSGNIGDSLSAIDNTNNILYWDSLLTLVTIDGFVIENGNSIGTTADPRFGHLGNGGGMYINARTGKSCIHINNCILRNNQASQKGAAIFFANVGCEGGAIRITNTHFNSNSSGIEGGAISLPERGNDSYASFIEHCFFTKNISRTGGAISILDISNCGTLRIENCEFIENQARVGGAIGHRDNYFTGGIHINKCLFKQNEAAGLGGAIMHVGTDTIQSTFINNCDFIENICGIPSGEGVGGAITFENIADILTGIPLVPHAFYNNRFIANLSQRTNFFTAGLIIRLYNNVFVDNTSFVTGGALKLSTTLSKFNHPHQLYHCVFLNNSAEFAAGAIEVRSSRRVQVEISNCIFSDNQAGFAPIIAVVKARYRFQNCIINEVASCDDIYFPSDQEERCSNTLFQQELHFRNPSQHDYSLLACSPGIDAGIRIDDLDTDFMGNARVLGAAPDIGAYEAPVMTLTDHSIIPTCQGTSNGSVHFQVENACEPLRYMWSKDGEVNNGISNLSAGTYAYTITDALFNRYYETIDIPETEINIDFETLAASNTTAMDGAIRIQHIIGGTAPYQVWIYEGTSLRDSTHLQTGDYEVHIEDANGCAQNFPFSIPILTNTTTYKDEASMRVLPNLVAQGEQAHLYFSEPISTPIQVQVFDIQAYLVGEKHFLGAIAPILPIPEASGVYLVAVQTRYYKQVFKVLRK